MFVFIVTSMDHISVDMAVESGYSVKIGALRPSTATEDHHHHLIIEN